MQNLDVSVIDINHYRKFCKVEPDSKSIEPLNLYLDETLKLSMKELSIIIPHERLDDVNSILYRHKVGGVYFFEIAGRGRAERQAVEATTVEGYRTGKKYVPEFGSRTMVQVIVPDSIENALVSDIMERLSTGSAGDGKVFVKDVTGAYDIGSKESGEKAAL